MSTTRKFVKHVICGEGFIWKQVILSERPMNVLNAVIEQKEEGSCFQ